MIARVAQWSGSAKQLFAPASSIKRPNATGCDIMIKYDPSSLIAMRVVPCNSRGSD